MGVVVRRYIDFLILLIPTPLVSALFCSCIPTFCSFINVFLTYIDRHKRDRSPFETDVFEVFQQVLAVYLCVICQPKF